MTDEPADEPPDLFGSESGESDATEATDAVDATDATEATDAVDATDVTEATDAGDAPLDDLAGEVRARRDARDSRSEVGEGGGDLPDDPFESVDVDHVDDEAVWESLAEDETGPDGTVGLGAEAERADDPDEHVVPKRGFCQRCPHFADPPETACTHEGTTIVEVVDADRFRVRNCPVVEDEDVATRFD
jgi:hypothetical protein